MNIMVQIITPSKKLNALIKHVDKEKVGELCLKYHIVKLQLFGSILTENFNEDSDIDILVTFDPDHIPGYFTIFRIEESLSGLFKRKVDLRTKNEISKYFRQDVLKKAMLIYE